MLKRTLTYLTVSMYTSVFLIHPIYANAVIAKHNNSHGSSTATQEHKNASLSDAAINKLAQSANASDSFQSEAGN